MLMLFVRDIPKSILGPNPVEITSIFIMDITLQITKMVQRLYEIGGKLVATQFINLVCLCVDAY